MSVTQKDGGQSSLPESSIGMPISVSRGLKNAMAMMAAENSTMQRAKVDDVGKVVGPLYRQPLVVLSADGKQGYLVDMLATIMGVVDLNFGTSGPFSVDTRKDPDNPTQNQCRVSINSILMLSDIPEDTFDITGLGVWINCNPVDTAWLQGATDDDYAVTDAFIDTFGNGGTFDTAGAPGVGVDCIADLVAVDDFFTKQTGFRIIIANIDISNSANPVRQCINTHLTMRERLYGPSPYVYPSFGGSPA